MPLDCIIMYKKGENMKDRRMNRNTKRQREIEMDPPENTERESKQRRNRERRASTGCPSPPHSPFPSNKHCDISAQSFQSTGTHTHRLQTHICAHIKAQMHNSMLQQHDFRLQVYNDMSLKCEITSVSVKAYFIMCLDAWLVFYG